MAIARASQRLTGVVVEPFHFRLMDVRDEQGLPMWRRVATADLSAFTAEVMADPLIREAINAHPDDHRFAQYVVIRMKSWTGV